MKELTQNEYQKRAMTTCLPSCENLSYMLLNLVGEVGEFSSKVAKAIRKGDLYIEKNKLCVSDSFAPNFLDWFEELKKEAGDMLWQLSGVCSVLGWTLNDVGNGNLDKLSARKAAGTIVGNGDGILRGK